MYAKSTNSREESHLHFTTRWLPVITVLGNTGVHGRNYDLKGNYINHKTVYNTNLQTIYSKYFKIITSHNNF